MCAGVVVVLDLQQLVADKQSRIGIEVTCVGLYVRVRSCLFHVRQSCFHRGREVRWLASYATAWETCYLLKEETQAQTHNKDTATLWHSEVQWPTDADGPTVYAFPHNGNCSDPLSNENGNSMQMRCVFSFVLWIMYYLRELCFQSCLQNRREYNVQSI